MNHRDVPLEDIADVVIKARPNGIVVAGANPRHEHEWKVWKAGVVGRENVIAGVDCGFGTFAGRVQVDTNIVWHKLQALVEGARLASRALW